jgi:hypothetical protein
MKDQQLSWNSVTLTWTPLISSVATYSRETNHTSGSRCYGYAAQVPHQRVPGTFNDSAATLIDKSIAGHSLRSGGATALALANVPAERIQLAGRWASDTFQIYIPKHPILLNAIIASRAAFHSARA